MHDQMGWERTKRESQNWVKSKKIVNPSITHIMSKPIYNPFTEYGYRTIQPVIYKLRNMFLI